MNIKEVNPKHNLYIVRVYGKESSLIKMGYSSTITTRLYNYYTHNPMVELVGTYYREDAESFEREFHKTYQSAMLNEWYSEGLLPTILNHLNGEKFPLLPIDNSSEKLRGGFEVNCVIYCNSIIKGDLEYAKVIALKYPILEEAYATFGIKKIKALKHRQTALRNELLRVNKVRSEGWKVANMLDYKVGSWVGSGEAKKALQSIYTQLEIQGTAKATDLANYYHIKEVSKNVKLEEGYGSKTVKGFVILQSRFNKVSN